MRKNIQGDDGRSSYKLRYTYNANKLNIIIYFRHFVTDCIVINYLITLEEWQKEMSLQGYLINTFVYNYA